MHKRTVDSIAQAVVRRMKLGGRRKGPPAPMIASSSGPARGKRRRPRAMVASAVGPQLSGAAGGPQAMDRLVGKLASMVGQRLAQQEAAKAGHHLATSRMTSNIIRGIAKQGADAPTPVAIELGEVDAAAVAKAVTQALADAAAARSDPTAIVASSITSRLRHVRVMATTDDAKAFQDKVSALVAQSIMAANAEAELAAAEIPIMVEPVAKPAEPVEAEAAAARKRN